MASLSKSLSLGRKALKWALLGLILKWWFQIVKKQLLIRKLGKSLPVPAAFDHFLLGFLMSAWKDPSRVCHRRLDYFRVAEEENSRRFDTIQICTPIWTNELIFLTRDPKMVKFMLKDEFDSFVKPLSFQSGLTDLLGEGIFNLNHGPSAELHTKWNFQRKTASKIFTKKIFTGHVHNTLQKNTKKFISVLDEAINKEQVDGWTNFAMKKLIYAFTLDSIGVIGFGVDLNTICSKEDVPFATSFNRVVPDINQRFRSPFWKTFGSWLYPKEIQIKKDIEVLDKFAEYVIDEHFKDAHTEGKHKGDILSLFVAADSSISRKLLRDIVMSFLLAGRDTTACTLSFTLFLLAALPDIQSKLFNEISEALEQNAKDSNCDLKDAVTLENLNNIPYLHAVLLECLRLFPPVPYDPKRCTKDTMLPTGEMIPAGSIMLYEVFVMGRDETVYENPGSFIPERWLGKGAPNQYDFPVFQAGPRICLGKDLAFYEAKFLIAQLLMKYEFKLPDDFAPKDMNLFKQDVSIVNGQNMIQAALTMSFAGDLNLSVAARK